jgi:ubiquinone biosynthesis protein
MKILRIRIIILQILRARQILAVIFKHAFSEWFNRSIFRRRTRRNNVANESRRQVHTTQERLRITIEELGPTYIKFGQILADRPDVVSERFRKELKKLQSKAIPLSDETALGLIEKELGCPIMDIFAEFDYNCLASASIGQVYKGILHSGERVIVKIQRPHIENKIKLDLYLMRYLARKTVEKYPELAAINIVGLVDEFGQSILKELDYYNEASNIARFNEQFKNNPSVYIPKVYVEYTTKRLLVMEQIQGITPDRTDLMASKEYDPETIARNGAEAVLQMIFDHGFFHADPHPGNIFIMPGNVIAFVDYGMAGVLRQRDRNFLADFAMGFASGNAKSIAKALVKLADVRFFNRMEDLEFEIEEIIKSNSHLPFDKIDFSGIMQKCVNLIIKYELTIPSSIYMLLKALATIQKFAGDIYPGLSLGPIILPYAKKMVLSKYDPRHLAAEVFDGLSDYAKLLRVFPSELSEILYKLKEGKIKHDVSLMDDARMNQALKQFSQRISLVILLTAMLLGSIILIVWGKHDTTLVQIGYTTSGIIGIYMLIKLFFKVRI